MYERTPEMQRVLDAVKSNVRAEEYYSEETDKAYLVTVELYDKSGLTFEMLYELSEALDTDRINLLGFGGAKYGSEWTGKYASDRVTIEVLK